MNRNKCCIEIMKKIYLKGYRIYWTETSVVLKYPIIARRRSIISIEPKQVLYWNTALYATPQELCKLNRNKCCIEMIIQLQMKVHQVKLNRNKCCIEIKGVKCPTFKLAKLNRNKCCIEIRRELSRMCNLRIIEPKQVLYWNLINLWIVSASTLIEPKQVLYWNKTT